MKFLVSLFSDFLKVIQIKKGLFLFYITNDYNETSED